MTELKRTTEQTKRTAEQIEQDIIDSNEGQDFVGMPNGHAIIKTTFWSDFGIAERFGEGAVEDTYKRAVKEWGKSIEYMTALSITLNHKIWETYTKSRALGRLYDRLWRECEDYIFACEDEEADDIKYLNFDKEEITYYVRARD